MEQQNPHEGLIIEFGDTEKVTEKLDTTVHERFDAEKNILYLTIGNTGFDFRYDREDPEDLHSRFDFLPEGKHGIVQERSGKYAFVFSAALRELRNWLKQQDNLNRYKIEPPLLPIKLKSVNFDVINGLYTMFERHGNHEEMVKAYKEGNDMIFDLEGFVALPEDDDLIQFLNKARVRANDINITYSKEIK